MCCFAHKLTQIVQILPDACINHAPVNADNKSADNGRVDFKQQLNALACDFLSFVRSAFTSPSVSGTAETTSASAMPFSA